MNPNGCLAGLNLRPSPATEIKRANQIAGTDRPFLTKRPTPELFSFTQSGLTGVRQSDLHVFLSIESIDISNTAMCPQLLMKMKGLKTPPSQS
jgi:hypothetical protein